MQEKLKCNSQSCNSLQTEANGGFNIIIELTHLKAAAGTLSRCYHSSILLVHILSLIKYFWKTFFPLLLLLLLQWI